MSSQFLIDWFYENYKDPAEGVPYETAEGGYQYFNGGPYHPKDVFEEAFPDYPTELIDEAVSNIIGYGVEWVKIEDY